MVSVNLLPAGIIAAKRRNRRMRTWLSIIAATAILSAVPLALDVSKSAAAASLESRLTPLESRLANARTELKVVGAQSDDLTAQLARADALRGKRHWSALLGLISAKAPDSVWFTALRTPTVGPQRTNPTPAAGSSTAPESVTLGGPAGLHLEGYALDHESLYAFMGALKESQVFKRVELTAAGKEPILSGTAVRFVLECFW